VQAGPDTGCEAVATVGVGAVVDLTLPPDLQERLDQAAKRHDVPGPDRGPGRGIS
jgi:hypothetical protein